jgi:ABC-2 type transport system ATP-binding protein
MLAIEAVGLRKSFTGVLAVDGLDLSVGEGEVVALLGPNGAGKTTTLMMLLGVTEPDSGSVELLGRRLPGQRAEAMALTGFSASYLGIPMRLRVREFLDVFTGLYGVPRRRVREVAGAFGIEHLLDRGGSQLSSGERTLVGLAKSMLNRPRLLVLDEPTASMDPEVAARIRRVLVSAQKEQGFTLLVTSHNMDEIERMCTRVIFIAGGKVVADGSPAEVAASYGAGDLEETFLSIASGEKR